MGRFGRAMRCGALLLGAIALLLAAGSAGAYDEVRVFGVVEGKSVAGSSVTLNGVQYFVSSASRLFDLEGAAIELAQLPFTPIEGHMVSEKKLAKAELRAAQVQGRWTVLSLRLVSELPR